MARLRVNDSERATTTTRLYADTVKVLKILAESHDMTMVDYIDMIAKQAAASEARHVQALLGEYGRPTAAGQTAKKEGK